MAMQSPVPPTTDVVAPRPLSSVLWANMLCGTLTEQKVSVLLERNRRVRAHMDRVRRTISQPPRPPRSHIINQPLRRSARLARYA
jgi:hypothetical protein